MSFNTPYKNIVSGILCLLLLFGFQNAQAHWTTRGPYGGYVSAFVQVDTTVYLGSPKGGVYRSTNSQLVGWRYENFNGLSTPVVTSLAGVGTTVVAGTNNGIFLSTNRGDLWAQSNTGLTTLSVLSLTSSNGNVYAGTQGGGVFKSTDSGATWSAANTGLTSLTVRCFAAMGDTIFAGTNDGVFASLNGGSTWVAVNTGLTSLVVYSLALSPDGLFAGTATGVFKGSLSTLTWATAYTGMPSNTRIDALAVSGSNIYAGSPSGVYVSNTATVSWSLSGLSGQKVKALISATGGVLAGTERDGVYKVNVGTWGTVNPGFNNLTTTAAAAADSTVIVANEKGVFVCANFVTSSVFVAANTGFPFPSSTEVMSLAIAGNKFFAATQSNGVYASTNGGASWSAANTGLGSNSAHNMKVIGSKIYVNTGTGYIYSTDVNTVSWSQYGSGVPTSTTGITEITGVADTIFIGGSFGVYRSIAGGAWTNTNLSRSVTGLTILDGEVYAGTDTAGVYKVDITGGTWTAMNNGLVNRNIQAIKEVDAYILVGFEGGAMATCNGGKTWKAFGTLDYLPDYTPIMGFVEIVNRMFAITPAHGLLGNGKGELPEAQPDTPSAISTLLVFCQGMAAPFFVPDDIEATSYIWTLPNGWAGASDSNEIAITAPNTIQGTITVEAVNGCGASGPSTLDIAASVCTGIDELNRADISAYPNPFSDKLSIEVPATSGITEVTLTDLMGRTILRTPTGESDKVVMNTTGVAKGVYVLYLLENGKAVTSVKVVKTN